MRHLIRRRISDRASFKAPTWRGILEIAAPMLLAGSPGETMPASRGYMNPAALMTASGHERTSTLGSLLVSCGPGAEVIALLVSYPRKPTSFRRRGQHVA